MVRIAFITGITGQDGSYLAELLLEKDYIVFGLIRRHSQICTARIDGIYEKLHLVYGDMTDETSLRNALKKIEDFGNSLEEWERLEIYNLAAQSHVKVSFEMPEYTAQTDGLGTLRLLECIRQSPLASKTRFYQASTSELFGDALESPQKETTPFNPQSPYAIAKLYSYWIVKNYREAHGLFTCNGILFNHTSPRRGETFVCRKITRGVAAIIQGRQEVLTLGNLDSLRDLGHARDYVRGMWMMLQVDTPHDLVLSMDTAYTVRHLVEMAFSEVGVRIVWNGKGLEEVGLDEETGRVRIRVHSRYFRPTEVRHLLGNSRRARTLLGWSPTMTTEMIIREMIRADLTAAAIGIETT